MQFALLGDIQFELITYFDGLEAKFGVDYAEHPRIEGKPRLQRIGDKLDEISLALKFHMTYCDPEAEIAKIRSAMGAYIPLPFVLATGDYKGEFVITDVAVTSEHTDTLGALISASVTVSLREAVDSVLASVALDAPGVVFADKPMPPGAKNSPLDQAKPNTLSSVLKDAALAGRQVVSAVSAAKRVIGMATLFKSNPLAAIASLRGGIPGVDKLVGAADKLGVDLSALQSSLKDAAPVLTMAGNVAAEARAAKVLLSNVTPGNLVSSLGSLAGGVSRIDKSLEGAAPAMAKLTAMVSTREVV